ncbi:OLC1v1009475C1 [Oldenlandia corymbosa var. corymbosa]|uniref:OLC1v1009475C1 n=1 Tax=Oldenlandia corymbosa var. corymbosa TaxID=529605 RepID=A0AAV1DPK4_OLDCO|nr:OLC1v1009475C1 [Oldenlandia corymbosa var. corymbosa]
MANSFEFGECPYQRHSTAFLTSMTWVLLMANSIGTILRAYSSGNYWFLSFILFVYSSLFILECCYCAYRRLPRGQKSPRKTLLGVAIWCLLSGIIFGFTYQFASLFDLVYAVILYAVAIIGSATVFYGYFIQDDEGDEKWDEKCRNGKDTSSDSEMKFSGGYVEIVFQRV